MVALVERLRTRVLPAVLTAFGVMFVAAGLLSYSSSAGPLQPATSPDHTGIGSAPSAGLITFPPLSPDASPSDGPPGSPAVHVASRIVIPALGIDLPIVAPPGNDTTYPLCNVAEYIQQLHQPGEPGATYIYAHARTGMFLPLLTQSQVNNGSGMVGDLVQVYTTDDQLYQYVISQVHRHVYTLDAALAETRETLWLQTSEGPHGTPNKLQVVATPLSVGPADHADANPTPHPVVCG
jgi:hypothetical protein